MMIGSDNEKKNKTQGHAQTTSVEDYVRTLDERVNQRITQGMKQAIKLIVERLDNLVDNKVNSRLEERIDAKVVQLRGELENFVR